MYVRFCSKSRKKFVTRCSRLQKISFAKLGKRFDNKPINLESKPIDYMTLINKLFKCLTNSLSLFKLINKFL